LDEIGLVVYEVMSFEAKVYGRTDGRRTKSDHKSSPCHFVTGELKIQKHVKVYKAVHLLQKLLFKQQDILLYKSFKNRP
jgi:hypothetical protein